MSLPILNSNDLLIIAGCQKHYLYHFRNNHFTYDGVPLKHNECYWGLDNHEIMGVTPDFLDIYQRILHLDSENIGNISLKLLSCTSLYRVIDFIHHFPNDVLMVDFDKQEFIKLYHETYKHEVDNIINKIENNHSDKHKLLCLLANTDKPNIDLSEQEEKLFYLAQNDSSLGKHAIAKFCVDRFVQGHDYFDSFYKEQDEMVIEANRFVNNFSYEKLFTRSVRNKELIDKRVIESTVEICFFKQYGDMYQNNNNLRRLNNFLNYYDNEIKLDTNIDVDERVKFITVFTNLSLLIPKNRSKIKINFIELPEKYFIYKHGLIDFIDNFNMSDDLLNKLLTSSLKDGIIDKERYEKIIAKTSKTINRNNKMKVV